MIVQVSVVLTRNVCVGIDWLLEVTITVKPVVTAFLLR